MKTMLKKMTANRSEAESDDTRVNITINPVTRKNLEEIKKETDKPTLAEVFRQAVFFYTVLFKEHQKGSEFLIRDSKGNVERFRMFV